MRIEKIKDEKGKIMTTKDGKELKERFLEEGDQFIPVFNSVNEKEYEANTKDGVKTLTKYSILARVRNKDKEEMLNDDGESGVFLTLTPSQANSLKKKINDGVDVNQHLFRVYSYENKHGKHLGVGLSNFKPPKSFKDFETENDVMTEEETLKDE